MPDINYPNSRRDCYSGTNMKSCGICKWFGEIREDCDDGYCNSKKVPTLRLYVPPSC